MLIVCHKAEQARGMESYEITLKEFVIDESNLYYADNAQNIHELIDKLNTLFKPHITHYLLSLSEEKYSQIHNDIFIKNEIPYFDEIDKLRKEKENGK